jgi:electron transfer flavoprotein alpha subunit
MEQILFLSNIQADGSLPNAALEALSAAVDLYRKIPGASLLVGLFGPEAGPAAHSIAGCGASRFLAVTGPEFAESRYTSDVPAIEALVRESRGTIIIAPTTSRISRALPGAVMRLQGRIETHVSSLEAVAGALRVQRWYYRQRMVATLTRTQRPWFLIIDPGVFSTWQGEAGKAAVEKLAVTLGENCNRTRVVGIRLPAVKTRTIRPDADFLFVAGAGWSKKQTDGKVHIKEAEDLILDFLKKSNASLGSTKSLVDMSGEGEVVLSFMSHLNQVGQTGSTPRHPKGLATCCHGEEPHTVGWRFINERRAINTDPNCGWAQGKADVLYVADAFKVMARVNELLTNDY